MNDFPKEFNPIELRKRSDDFQKQAKEIRQYITRNMSALTGMCEINIDKYGEAVIRQIKEELEGQGWRCEIYNKEIKRVNERYMKVGF